LAEGEWDSSHWSARDISLLFWERAVRAKFIGTGRVLRSWAMREMGTFGSDGAADCESRDEVDSVRKVA
jgi:hypothetical protein